MATLRWIGAAKAVAQVTTVTPGGTIAATDTFRITRGAKWIEFTATTTTVAHVVTGLVAAAAVAQAAGIVEFSELTFTDSTTCVTITGPTSGKPFILTLLATNVSGGAAPSLAQSTTTTAVSPNHFGTAANWDNGTATPTAPAAADTIYWSNSDVDCLYDIDQNAITLTAMYVEQSFTGKIGLKDHNGNWPEDLEKYLKISATTIRIGEGPGSGSNLVRLNVGSVACTLHVLNSGTSDETGLETILWKGTSAANIVNVLRGSVGIAVKPGEAATVATLRVGYDTNIQGDATVRCGSGATLTTVTQTGGDLSIASNSTTVTKTDGILTVNGAATLTTLNLDGGPCYYRSTGMLTTAKVGDGGELNFSKTMEGRIVVDCTVNKGASVLDPNRSVTWVNPILLNRCTADDVTFDVGTHVTLKPGLEGNTGSLVTNGQVVAGFVPLDLQTQRSGDYVNLANYHHATVIFFKGTGTDGDDPILTLQQAQDNAGTGVKALNFSSVYIKQNADVQTVAAFTTITGATGGIHTFSGNGNTYTNTDGHLQAIWMVEIERSDLDIAGGFTYLRATLNDTGSNAQLGTVLYILTKPLDSTLPSAL